MIEPFAEDLYIAHGELKMPALDLGTRMTVVRLPDGGLWLHSPIRLDEDDHARLAELGPVKHVVAPNLYHHLFVDACLARYPDAALHLAPGFDAKRPELKPATVLGDSPPAAWGGVFEQVLLGGMPRMQEVVFFHRPSKTLIVTDLLFNLGRPKGFAGLFTRLTGAYGKLAVTRILRLLIKDKAAFGASVARVLEWDVERVTLTHGDVIDTDARARVEAALRPWADQAR